MMRVALLSLIVLGLVGCGSGDSEAVNVPPSATQGGNVVTDPAVKQQIMGSEGQGGGEQQSGLSTTPN
jgi:hypothetical protein